MMTLIVLLATVAGDVPWPPPAGQLRVVIDTDAANEIDDHYALALALGCPDRLKIEGIVAAHFGTDASVQKSFDDIQLVLKHAGLSGRIPVKKGLGPLRDRDTIPDSEGVDFILERARAGTPENPVWLVLLGAVTNAVAALKRDPTVADRMIVFWHGRSAWPKECRNFNARKDPVAARLVFELPSRFVLFDTGAQIVMPTEETARRFAPIGPLGEHLQAIRSRHPSLSDPKKGLFDLGDIAALVDPACVVVERSPIPAVTEKLEYDFSSAKGELLRIKDVDAARSFDLLEEALRRLKP